MIAVSLDTSPDATRPLISAPCETARARTPVSSLSISLESRLEILSIRSSATSLVPSSIASVPLPMVDEVARPLNGAGPSSARLTQQHMAQIKMVCGRGGNTITKGNIE